MDDTTRRGQWIILIVITGLVLETMLSLFLPGSTLRGQAPRLVIVTVLLFLMWRGYGWARSYVAFSLGIAALLTAISGVLLVARVWWGFLLALFAPLYAWGAWALWSSPQVDAYIDYCERERNPSMSLSDR